MTTQEITVRQCLEVKSPPKSEEDMLTTLRFHQIVPLPAPLLNKMPLRQEDSWISPRRLLLALLAFPASHRAKCCDELFIPIDIIGTMASESCSFRLIK